MKKTLSLIFLSLLLLLFVIPASNVKNAVSINSYVYAEDEEEDEEHDREEEDEDEEHDHDEEDEDKEDGKEDDYEYEEQKVYVGKEIPPAEDVIEVPVTTYINVVDTGYDVDTDGDKLVDALDPNPTIPEPLLFTDTDDDGVPDATDMHPTEDDFEYIYFEDTNNNGISDSFEF